MTISPLQNRSARPWPGWLCGLAGAVIFQFFGNATHGYIRTSSLFYWWGLQWFNADSETQHGTLVLLVAGWLFIRNLRSQENGAVLPVRPVVPGLVMAGALGVHLLGYATQQPRISIFALLVFCWGFFWFVGGRRWARASLFPLGFLLLAVPVNFLDSIGFYLQLGVTNATYTIAHAAGIGVIRNGTQLFAPDGHYQYDVAAACSGLRSLIALLALALLVGYLNFHSVLGRAAVVGAGLVYVYLGNVVRVSAIVFAGERFGRAAGERVHAVSGVLVFVFVLGLLLATISVVKRFFPTLSRDETTSLPPAEEDRNLDGVAAVRQCALVAGALVAAALGVAAATMKLDALPLAPTAGIKLAADGVSPVELPPFIGSDWIGRRVEVTSVERSVLPADTGYSRRTYIELAHPENEVFLSLVLSGRDRTSIHRPELCLVGQGWTIGSRFRHDFETSVPAAFPMSVLRITREIVASDGRRVSVPALLAYAFVSSDGAEPTYRGMLWRSATDRLVRLRADRWAYVVAQTNSTDGETAALARLQTVLGAAAPEFLAASH